ncbi:hypothetical protein AB1Y20_016005 [Prymnesium parvum]|uniref:30S ribosomal protein S21 n=1 Tax=Prymnesium parvum TaxID=97485 RepID=A0AB34IPA5_PRYPA
MLARLSALRLALPPVARRAPVLACSLPPRLSPPFSSGSRALSSLLPRLIGAEQRRAAPPAPPLIPRGGAAAAGRGAPFAAPRSRGIITVHTSSLPEGAEDTRSDAGAKSEDMALQLFNRLVRTEVKRKLHKGGSRGQRRFGFYKQPSLRRRDAAMGREWKEHKKKLSTFLNWIQYRRHRNQD